MSHFAPLDLAYVFCAAVFALLAWSKQRRSKGHSKSGRFWLIIAASLLVLGIIRVARLQLNITDIGRDEAVDAGIYNDRRDMQLALIASLAAAAALTIGLLRGRLAKDGSTKWLAVAGVIWLTLLTLIRAISYHYADQFFGKALIGPLNIGGALDGSILILLTIEACWIWRSDNKSHGSSSGRKRSRHRSHHHSPHPSPPATPL